MPDNENDFEKFKAQVQYEEIIKNLMAREAKVLRERLGINFDNLTNLEKSANNSKLPVKE